MHVPIGPVAQNLRLNANQKNQTQALSTVKLLFSRGFYFREFREPDAKISTSIHVYF